MSAEQLRDHELGNIELIETVRIIPHQMLGVDTVRELLQKQRVGPMGFQPWRAELTRTFFTLRGKETSTPDSITLIGGSIPDNDDGGKMTTTEAALRNLARAAHAYGITDTDLSLVRERTPFLWHKNSHKVRCQETVYAAEVPPDFTPYSLDPKSRHHEFYSVGNKYLRKILTETEELKTNDGKRYTLIGNLRSKAKDRIKDHHLLADGEDVRLTKEAILDSREQFEMDTRRQFALRMIEMIPKDPQLYSDREGGVYLSKYYYSDFSDSWKDKWRERLLIPHLHSSESRDKFQQQYEEFLQEYMNQITHDQREQFLIRDMCKAIDYISAQKLLRFNARLESQAPYREVIQPKLLGGNSDRYKDELFKEGPTYFADYIQFIEKTLGTKNSKDTFAKLLDLRNWKIGQMNGPDGNPLTQQERNEITLNYTITVRSLYEAFMEKFLPEDDYLMYLLGVPDEEKRFEKFLTVYAKYSELNDQYIKFLTDQPARSLASHDAIVIGLETRMSVQSDQLIEHILGTFGINPFREGPILVEPVVAYEYRRKMMGIIQDMRDGLPHHEEQVAQDTYFMRDLLRTIAVPGSNEEPYMLVYNPQLKRSSLVHQRTSPLDIQGIPIQGVSVIHVLVDGIHIPVAYFVGSKKFEEEKRKVQERAYPISDIKDVTRFAIFLGDFEKPSSMSAHDEKIFRKNLVLALEIKLQETAENPIYDYQYGWAVKERKEALLGERPTAGSGASKSGLQVLKEYITITKDNGLETHKQMQEVRFMPSLDAAVEWQLDTEYAQERIRTPKLEKVEEDGVVVYQFMTFPLIHVEWPPWYSHYRSRYIDLMQGKVPRKPLPWYAEAVNNWIEGLQGYLNSRFSQN